MRGVLSLLSLPPTVAHEAAHAAVAQPWVRAQEFEISVTTSRAKYRCDVDPEMPRWARTMMYLAPTLIGTVLGAVVLLWCLFAGFDAPETVVGWARLTVALGAWWVFVHPSKADRDGALG